MFDYVVASVSPDIATEIRDLILTPPAENQYARLKEELIRLTATSQQRRIQQLLSTEVIGDRKPTQFLHRLQQLASDTIQHDSVFLCELFLQRLPANVRIVLASTNDSIPITELAQLADKVMKVAIPVMSKVSVQSSVPPSPSEVELLQGKVIALEQEIKTLQQATRAQLPRQRSPSPQRYSTRNPRYAGIIKILEPLLRNVDHPVHIWEMTRPATDGDQCFWPITLVACFISLILQMTYIS